MRRLAVEPIVTLFEAAKNEAESHKMSRSITTHVLAGDATEHRDFGDRFRVH